MQHAGLKQKPSAKLDSSKDGVSQRSIGSQAVLHPLPQRQSEVPMSAGRRPSWDFARVPIAPPERRKASRQVISAAPTQTSIPPMLVVGAIDDPLEREADRVADEIMRMPAASHSVTSAPAQISREFAGCEEADRTKLQMRQVDAAEPADLEAPPGVHEMLSSTGQPLDAATRGYFEPRFEQDFSQVRVHTDEPAAASARTLGTLAYTVGPHIAFAAGRFVPSSGDGRRLLAHELAHVVQQGATIDGPAQAAPLVQRDTFAPSTNRR